MKNASFLTFVVLVLLAGCSKPREIKQEHNFVNQNWQKFDTLRFSVEATPKEPARDLNLIIRYNSLFTPKSLPVSIIISTPDGAESVIEKKIWVRNTDDTPRGKRFGEASWDYTFCFREGYEFTTPGIYNILIDNETGKFDNNGIEMIAFEAIPKKKEEKKEPKN